MSVCGFVCTSAARVVTTEIATAKSPSGQKGAAETRADWIAVGLDARTPLRRDQVRTIFSRPAAKILKKIKNKMYRSG